MLDKVCGQLCNFRPGEIKCFIADTILLASDGKLHSFGIMVNREDVAVSSMTACAILVFQKVSKFLIAWVIFLKKFCNAKFTALKSASTHDFLVQFFKTVDICDRFAILNRCNGFCRYRRVYRFRFSEQSQLLIFLFSVSKRFELLLIRYKSKPCIGNGILREQRCIIRNFSFSRFFFNSCIHLFQILNTCMMIGRFNNLRQERFQSLLWHDDIAGIS